MTRLRMIAPALDVIERSAGFHRAADIVIERLNVGESDEATSVLVDAYRSSEDSLPDDGDQLDLFWAGEWGPPVPAATVCARQARGGDIVGLSLVCLLDGLPLVAHLVVAESARRNGVAARLLEASASGLLSVGIDTVELAVDAANRGALHLYARLGFRFDAPACVHRGVDNRPWIGYAELPAFDGLRSALLAAMPDLDASPDYVVGARDQVTGRSSFAWPATSAGHHLPGWILALVTGWRSGECTVELSAGELDTAIALLSPAESATMFGRPNLNAWRAIRAGAGDDAVFVAQFSSSSA